MSRNYKRDARGRFARSGGSIAGAAAGAAIGGALGSKAMRKRYVSGSLQDHSRIGTLLMGSSRARRSARSTAHREVGKSSSRAASRSRRSLMRRPRSTFHRTSRIAPGR